MKKRDYSIINAISTSLLAFFFTIPFHEFLHVITFLIYGDKIRYFSAGSVGPVNIMDYSKFSPLHRIMVAGGSASILNAIIGVGLLIFLVKVRRISGLLRLFLVQLMGGQMLEGFGYFLIGGYFGAGDWGNVYSYFEESPGTVAALRIILSVVGTIAIPIILYFFVYINYQFIENPSDKRERSYVALRVNLMMFVSSVIVSFLAHLRIPEVVNGDIPYFVFMLYDFMWFPYFAAWIYTIKGIMVKPPKVSRKRSSIPKEAYVPIWVLALILALIDIIIFGKGVYFG